MATYRKLSNKVKASMSTGSGSNEVFKPDWFAYNSMTFLRDVYEAKKTISTCVSLFNFVFFNTF